MVLQRGDVVVPQRQLRLRVDLVDVVVARVVEVVADARSQQDQHFKIADFGREVDAPRYGVQLQDKHLVLFLP